MSASKDDEMSELQKLQEKIRRVEAERDQERRRADGAEQRADQERQKAEEEKQRADQATQRADDSENTQRPTNLLEFLNVTHLALSLPITVQEDKTLTTQGGITDPTGKHIPTYFQPWDSFLHEQFLLWRDIEKADPLFKTYNLFASLHHIQSFTKSIIAKPMSSEDDLRFYERQNVESHVTSVIKEFIENDKIAHRLRIEGKVDFENHLNMLTQKKMVQDFQNIQLTTPTRTISDPFVSSKQQSSANPKADQVVIYENNNQERIACMFIEYKPAHKLTLANIQAGLRPMNPHEDIINNPIQAQDDPARFEENSQLLVAAAMSQCFSYMIEKGLMYGYVCTGQAFIFLRIPEDPSTAYYFLSIPNQTVGETTGWEPDSAASNRLHLTAIGQVLIFTLRAMMQKPRDQKWQKHAQKTLKKWKVDYELVLAQIPESERKEPPSSPYQPPKPTAGSFNRSPHFLRSQNSSKSKPKCDSPKDEKILDDSESDDYDDDDHNDLDYPQTPKRSKPQVASAPSASNTPSRPSRNDHRNRPYCTQRCLLGLFKKGFLDIKCPNFSSHPSVSKRHTIDHVDFLKLVQEQLASDLDVDCTPWYVQGSRGAMFKITLTSHGYTVAAKGTVFAFISILKHEEQIYNRLRAIQGLHIPVCLGSINLRDPFYLEGAEIIHMMIMAYGGPRVDKYPAFSSKTPPASVFQQITETLSEIHTRRILHRDPFPRNILWNEELQSPLFIDFERSEVVPPRNSSQISKKRKWAAYDADEEDKENWNANIVQDMLEKMGLKQEQGLGSGSETETETKKKWWEKSDMGSFRYEMMIVRDRMKELMSGKFVQ